MNVVEMKPEKKTFDDFWNKHYPHPRNRGSKKKARVLFECAEDPKSICLAADMYRRWLHDTDDWRPPPKMAETWLRGEEWEGWMEQAEQIQKLDVENEKYRIIREAEEQAKRDSKERERRELEEFQADFHSDPERKAAWFEQPVPRPKWEDWKRQWIERKGCS